MTNGKKYKYIGVRVLGSSPRTRTKINHKGAIQMYQINLPFNGSHILIQYNKLNIHIVDSFRVKTKRDMSSILDVVFCAACNRGIFYTRKLDSLVREWKAHNVLYNFGYKRERTGSVDLNENESLSKKIGYFFLSFLG